MVEFDFDGEEDRPVFVKGVGVGEATVPDKNKKNKKKTKEKSTRQEGGKLEEEACPCASPNVDTSEVVKAVICEEKTEQAQQAQQAGGELPECDGDLGEVGEADGESVKKNKKKKKAKKSGGNGAGGVTSFHLPAQDNSVFVLVGDLAAKESSRFPATCDVPVAVQYPDLDFPVGEIQEYGGDNAFRTTSAEKREMERLLLYDYEKVRKGAECHRQVRRYVQSWLRPGLAMIDVVQRLERKTHELIQANGLECGWGFPTGCSLNWVAAHWTPNTGDTTVLKYDDVCKLDFGVQVGGRIIDCAFTVAFDPKYETLIQSTQDGTNTGIKEAGIDARLGEVGAAIQETIESFELELNGKVKPIKCLSNLCGHSMEPYHIHAGKSVPIVKCPDNTKMEEGEFYAIETFASNGKGYTVDDLECSHYMKYYDGPSNPQLRAKGAKALLQVIDENIGTLGFCRRWLDDMGHTRHLLALKNLVDNDVVMALPPLCEQRGSYTSQMEHTILLRPTCKEVVSRGEDF